MNASAPDEPANAHDLFISYSRKDLQFAQPLERTLDNYSPPKGLGRGPRTACASFATKAT